MKIYVDAMGGDLAPAAPVKGSLAALRKYPGLEIIQLPSTSPAAAVYSFEEKLERWAIVRKKAEKSRN